MVSNETFTAQTQANNTNSSVVSNETMTLHEELETLPIKMNDTESNFADHAFDAAANEPD